MSVLMRKKDVKLRLTQSAWRKLRAEAARRRMPMAHVLLEVVQATLDALPDPQPPAPGVRAL